MLTGREHWATVNRLIVTRMNEDMYQTVTSYFPDNQNDIGALDPAELLRQIEARLVTADQLEYKRLRFELAKQQPEENPWRYENRLLLYYRAVQINDEGWFVEINKKGTTHP